MSKPSFRSPSGNLIMTKLPRAIRIWTLDGVRRENIERSCPVQSVTWLPHGEGKSAQVGFGKQIDETGTHNQDSYLLRRTQSLDWYVDLYANVSCILNDRPSCRISMEPYVVCSPGTSL